MLRLIQKRFFNYTHLLRNNVSLKTSPKIVSSCKVGTSLNLGIKKDGKEPVALADEEYPEWLWTVLDKSKARDNETFADQSLADRKRELRKLNRSTIKQRNFLNQL